MMSTYNYIHARLLKKQNILFLLLPIFILIIMLPHSNVSAYDITQGQSIYDDAGLLSGDQILSLETKATKVEDKLDMDIIILTTNSLGSVSEKKFIENFYDYAYDVAHAIDEDAAILLVSMDPNNRRVVIQGYGSCESLINNDRIERMLDAIVPSLSDQEYEKAFEQFITKTKAYMKDDPNIFFHTWFQLSIALLIGGISVGVMAYTSSGKVTTNDHTYLDQGTSRVLIRRDDYIRTTTTRVKKPEPTSNSSSSGGGGVSSGGHSHSGGGRSF